MKTTAGSLLVLLIAGGAIGYLLLERHINASGGGFPVPPKYTPEYFTIASQPLPANNEDLAVCQAMRDNYKNELDTIGPTVPILEAEKTALEKELVESKTERDELNRRIAELEEEGAEDEKIIDDLKKKIAELEKIIADLEKKIAELEKIIGELEGKIVKLERIIADLEKIIAERERIIEVYRQEESKLHKLQEEYRILIRVLIVLIVVTSITLLAIIWMELSSRIRRKNWDGTPVIYQQRRS